MWVRVLPRAPNKVLLFNVFVILTFEEVNTLETGKPNMSVFQRIYCWTGHHTYVTSMRLVEYKRQLRERVCMHCGHVKQEGEPDDKKRF